MSKKLLFNFNREVIQNYTYVKYVGTIITATNTLEKPIKGAILKGSTKYRDIDTGEFLETFEEGRNLELVSVKTPVLKTVSGFNLLNPNAEPIAYQGNDVLHPDYFKAKFGDSFSVTKKTSGELWCSLFCYDSDKNLIKAYYQNNHPVPRTITLNDDSLMDVAYVRFECAKWTPFKDIMLNYGEQMPFAEYSGEYKTNILTVNEDVELRGIGEVQDTLDLMTGEVTQRVGKTTITGDLVPSIFFWERNSNSETICFENFGSIIPFQWNQIISVDWLISNDGYNPSLTHEYFNPLGGYGIFRIKRSRLETEDVNGFKKWLNENPITIYHPVIGSESIKTVDLSILDQNENKVSSISSFNDTTHIMASSETIPPIFEGYLATKEVE